MTSAEVERRCITVGCGRTDHSAWGMCNKHYVRWLRDRDRAHYRELSRRHNRARRGVRSALGRCEDCLGVFALTADGSRFRRPHKAVDGSVCRGYDLPVCVVVEAVA